MPNQCPQCEQEVPSDLSPGGLCPRCLLALGLTGNARSDNPMIGQNVGHYTVLQELGRGGMGRVYLAQDTSLDRKVALKFLPEHVEQNPTARLRFLREAKCAAAIDHPYICKIYEIGEFEGKDFISMEYIRGQTLKDEMAEYRLPLEKILQIGSDIAEALESAFPVRPSARRQRGQSPPGERSEGTSCSHWGHWLGIKFLVSRVSLLLVLIKGNERNSYSSSIPTPTIL